MSLRRYSLVATLCIVTLLVGCSDDDVVAPGPGDPSIVTVEVSPKSATLTNIGESVQLEGAAFDASGTMVDTVFVWQSSAPELVAVGSNGVAVALGIGTAEIYASVAGLVDTAMVTVDVLGSPTIDWVAAGSGDWQNGASWSGGVAPAGDDIAVIALAGTYTVSLTGDVQVEGLLLGNDSGIQTLATGANTLTLATGALVGGAEVSISGTVRLQEDMVWSGGSVIGPGTMEVLSSAEMNVIGNPVEMTCTLVNKGALELRSGAVLRINGGTLQNNVGALIELQGDAIVSVFFSGSFTNTGAIHKNVGDEEAAILTSASIFTTNGTLRVDAGSLWISGGSLSNIIDIGAGSTIRQSGATAVPSIISRGEGAFEINGSVIFGTFTGQTMTIRHVILDSGALPAMSGPANLQIAPSFTWRRGFIGEFGEFITQNGSLTRFETTQTKVLSISTWDINGDVEADGAMTLTLQEGAGILIQQLSRWTQELGGRVNEGIGGSSGIRVNGELCKVGSGSFVINTSLDCAGTLNLKEGALTVEGAFRLLETGVITGGGTEAVNNNVRLIVVKASSAEMLGTIRPDLDGAFARMGINGLVNLGSTFHVELDVPLAGEIPTESLNFLTGGQELGGILDLNVMRAPDPGEWRAISLQDGTGAFAEINGGEAFTGIITDARGVLLTR